ncbi:MAG: hydroxymethylglutaryl-CoA reductase, degradative [Aerococcus sp.]|nr:hydroxymethylglutaryl-CoA reductase, degradative [Aerococcus sp.]
MNPADFHHFYQKTITERREILERNGLITPDQMTSLTQTAPLSETTIDSLIENAIGTYPIPLGVATNFVIDGEEFLIPMAIEEPSVIAAASNGAKMAKVGGGFKTEVTKHSMIGEIVFTQVDRLTLPLVMDWLNEHQPLLLQVLSQAHPSLSKRGGGAESIRYACFPSEAEAEYFVIYVNIDTQEAMGANMVNTMLESLKAFLVQQFQEMSPSLTPLMAILSNYGKSSLASASVSIPFDALDKENGETVATQIVQASRLAQLDRYRAATHNKGIMNGVDAVVMATGNDWRAIEAGAHAYAAKDNYYRGLSHWQIDVETRTLSGKITLPLPIGTVGGSIRVHSTAQIAHSLLHHPEAKRLMGIIASVGLAQNLAALKALVTTGIQSGHMALQARTLALQVGATTDEIPAVVEQLIASHDFSLGKAQEVLEHLRHQ